MIMYKFILIMITEKFDFFVIEISLQKIALAKIKKMYFKFLYLYTVFLKIAIIFTFVFILINACKHY